MTKKLGFGCMRLPLLHKDDPASVDIALFETMVDMFLDRGFTYFDTAYMYHKFTSEKILREALVKRHLRNSFTIASKLPTMFLKTEYDQERIFSEQLEKCGVDYFDYYLLHNLNSSNYAVARRLRSFDFIEEKKKDGKIRHIGFSFHDGAELLDRILAAHPEIEFVQLQINYLDWDDQGIQSRACYETARRYGKPVIVMEPVKGGMLAKIPPAAESVFEKVHPDWSPASWAIRFAAGLEGVMMVLSGMSSSEQMDDNTSYMQDFYSLGQSELDCIRQAASFINGSIAVPCTGCGYCTEGCPQKIAIPVYFALYNAAKRSSGGDISGQKSYYANYIRRYGKASDCIRCRNCERTCPQHLPVSTLMKDVADCLEQGGAYSVLRRIQI